MRYSMTGKTKSLSIYKLGFKQILFRTLVFPPPIWVIVVDEIYKTWQNCK